jgi:hypothetical protein
VNEHLGPERAQAGTQGAWKANIAVSFTYTLHFMSFLEKDGAEGRAQETVGAGDEDPH